MENLQRVGLLFFIQTVNQTSLKVLNRYDCSLLNQLPSASLKMSLVVVVQSLSSVRLLQPCGLQPTRLFCPWDFPGKNTRMDCHFLLQGIFQTQELNLGLLHCRRTPVLQADSLPPEPDGKPRCFIGTNKTVVYNENNLLVSLILKGSIIWPLSKNRKRPLIGLI